MEGWVKKLKGNIIKNVIIWHGDSEFLEFVGDHIVSCTNAGSLSYLKH